MKIGHSIADAPDDIGKFCTCCVSAFYECTNYLCRKMHDFLDNPVNNLTYKLPSSLGAVVIMHSGFTGEEKSMG